MNGLGRRPHGENWDKGDGAASSASSGATEKQGVEGAGCGGPPRAALPNPENGFIRERLTARENTGWNAKQGRAKINCIGGVLNPWPFILPATAAAGIATWGAVGPSAELFGPTVRHTASAKTLALTFDDGPNPAVTPRLLDLFDRYSARATFFLIGKFARACPDLVREISARGHLLGNHTDTHPSLIFQSPARIRGELLRCQDAIGAALRTAPPRWMRPPYGYRSPLLSRELQRA